MQKIFGSISELPDSVRDRLTTAQQRQWLRVWNSVFRRRRSDGASVEVAEAAAFRQANGVVKLREPIDFLKRVTIEKLDDEQQMVWGWAYVCKGDDGIQVIDHGGDVVDIADIQTAAEDFMLSSRVGGVMHKDQAGFVAQSIVVTDELAKELGLATLKRGWLIGFKVTDADTWEGVKSGRLKAFSIGGTANPEAIEDGAA